MELKIGDIHECPEGHKAKIVWIKENKKVIGVKCPKKHLSKIEKRKKVYGKNFVFLINLK